MPLRIAIKDFDTSVDSHVYIYLMNIQTKYKCKSNYPMLILYGLPTLTISKELD